MERLKQLSVVLQKESIRNNQSILNKQQWAKVNGWGYKDTEFVLHDDGSVSITGSRYQFAGQKMPHFKQWMIMKTGIEENKIIQAQKEIPIDPPIVNEDFFKAVSGKVDQITTAKLTRINHSHGHSLKELFLLRYSKFPRSVDCVIYITSHQQAQIVIKAASQFNVVIIPFGGGTNVTQSLLCNQSQKRTIVSVDTTRMNKIKWVDKKDMMACVEAGIIGKDLERQLSKYGVCCGHEPDSVQFSSLGGWVSTRASGMKKNRYGNIDDIVINIKIATPIGTFQKNQTSPRVSSGPDINHFILGRQGNFGIISQCVIKVRPIPQAHVYQSILFHNYQEGIKFMYDVSQSKVWPASCRLVDNMQFQFGMALKTQEKSKWETFVNKAKKYFVTQLLKFDPEQMCLCTILFEGTKQQVNRQQKIINVFAKKYNGFKAGPQNGQRGYFLTFVIGYLRDFGLKYYMIAQSFETSLPWKDVSKMCDAVSKRIRDDCKRVGVKKEPFISFRVTQLYDIGACVYVYFGFWHYGIQNPIEVYSMIEDNAREQIMKYGGCISHHHGVGKLRKKFLPNSIGNTGLDILKGVKATIDPKNIFATGNLVN